MATVTTNLVNVGIPEFKVLAGASKLDILKNPKTDKLFISASNGKNYKVQQNIDTAKEMVFLIEDGKIEEACLINKSDKGLKALFTL